MTSKHGQKVNDIGELPAIADLYQTLKQLLGMKNKCTNKCNVHFYCNELHATIMKDQLNAIVNISVKML